MESPVHRLDSRAKIIVTLAFIIIVMSFPRHTVSALTPFLIYPLALLCVGHIPARHILTKLLLAAPFAVLVGIFNPLMDHQPVGMIGPFTLTGGWITFASILLRFTLTVGAALTLVACTGMHRLGAGLEQLGCPRVFVVQLLFLHRYLFVIADEGVKMMRAVELRSTGTRSLRFGAYGSLVGHLLLRAMDRAGRVYQAMVARGFDGEIHVLHPTGFGAAEWIFVVGWVVFFALARMWNLAEAVGRLLTGGLR
jgi:cobalt/nickel transport system permease protein